MKLLLAPMEGLLDATLRDVLTRAGGLSRCVSEFIRVTDTLLPERVFFRVMPELADGGCTPAGVPVRGQLLGSDPVCLADNAARLASLSPHGVDLNFGCPAKVVNRHGGGAALLDLDAVIVNPLNVAERLKLIEGRIEQGFRDLFGAANFEVRLLDRKSRVLELVIHRGIEPLPATSPLWDMPNVLISPHSASTVTQENGRIANIFCHNLLCYLDGRWAEMRNVLDKARLY